MSSLHGNYFSGRKIQKTMWIKQLVFINYLYRQRSLSASDSVGPDYLLSCCAFLPCLVKSWGWKGKWFLGELPAAGESSIWSQCIPGDNKPSKYLLVLQQDLLQAPKSGLVVRKLNNFPGINESLLSDNSLAFTYGMPHCCLNGFFLGEKYR